MAVRLGEKKVGHLVEKLVECLVGTKADKSDDRLVVHWVLNLAVDWDVKMVEHWVVKLVGHLAEQLVVNWALMMDKRLVD